MPDERYDVEAVLRERTDSLPLPRRVSWVGRDAYGDVFRVDAWSLAPEIRADMGALLAWLAVNPGRRWAHDGRGRAVRMLREFELEERMRAAKVRARWMSTGTRRRRRAA